MSKVCVMTRVQCIFAFTFSCAFEVSLAWQAFMGQEAVPTLPGTNLDSSLILPSTESSATIIAPGACSIALTSFRKLSTGTWCALGQNNCSLQVNRRIRLFTMTLKLMVDSP